MRRWVEDGWERLLGADPGQLRVVFALRLFLMASLTVLGLIGANWLGKMPIGAIGLGFMVAQFNAGAVRDRGKQGQVITSALVAMAGLGGATLASLLTRWPIVSDAALVALVFLATLSRQAGPRATGCGMLAFIGFYLNLIIRVPIGELPFEVASAAYAVAIALLVRLLLLPDRPERSLPRVVLSVRRQTARLLETMRDLIRIGGKGAKWSNRLARRSARLDEAVAAADEQIESLGGKPPEDGWSRIGMVLFELQIGAERVSRLASERLAALQGHPLLIARLEQEIGKLGPVRSSFGAGEPPCSAQGGSLDPLVLDALTRLAAATEALPTDPQAILAAAHESVLEGVTTAEAKQTSDQATMRPLRTRLLALLRQPIQVAAATTAAIVAGHLVSNRRWYWSVLAAFIMFAGTSSRASTLIKGAQRVLGTLLGVGAGLLIAGAVIGHPKLILALALLCDMAAFYAFQTAYSVMMFWITVMIALLYSLLGMFRPVLLEIRLDETALGAALGILVALTLLPRRTSEEMRDAGLGFLDDLHAALAALPGETAEAGRTAQARRLARTVQTLRTAAGPLGRGWAAATALPLRETVRAAMACSYWLHELGTSMRSDPGAAAEPIRQLGEALERAHEAIAAGSAPARIVVAEEDAARLPTLAAFAAVANRFVRALDQATRRRRRRPVATLLRPNYEARQS